MTRVVTERRTRDWDRGKKAGKSSGGGRGEIEGRSRVREGWERDRAKKQGSTKKQVKMKNGIKSSEQLYFNLKKSQPGLVVCSGI